MLMEGCPYVYVGMVGLCWKDKERNNRRKIIKEIVGCFFILPVCQWSKNIRSIIPYIKISKYQNMGGLVLMDWFECIRVVDKFLKLLTVEVFCAKVGLLSKGLKEVLVLILKYGKI